MENERTLALIKPEAVKRNIIGEVIKRMEAAELKIVAIKMVKANLDLATKHYPDSMIESLGEKGIKNGYKADDPIEQGKKIIQWLREYITSGPVVAMVLQGENAVKKLRQISGYTDPCKAEPGTIRGDLSNDSIVAANEEGRTVHNIVHASETIEEAEKEIALWFRPEEIYDR